jgi:hypothetical protein
MSAATWFVLAREHRRRTRLAPSERLAGTMEGGSTVRGVGQVALGGVTPIGSMMSVDPEVGGGLQ